MPHTTEALPQSTWVHIQNHNNITRRAYHERHTWLAWGVSLFLPTPFSCSPVGPEAQCSAEEDDTKSTPRWQVTFKGGSEIKGGLTSWLWHLNKCKVFCPKTDLFDLNRVCSSEALKTFLEWDMHTYQPPAFTVIPPLFPESLLQVVDA